MARHRTCTPETRTLLKIVLPCFSPGMFILFAEWITALTALLAVNRLSDLVV
jgi:phosphatidylglycerophosphate synthase